MSTIEERLDKVRELIQDDDFLESKGLSNEVNIRIFCYEPEDEMAVRRIGFYRRNGFHLWDNVPYLQPSYGEGREPCWHLKRSAKLLWHP